MRNLLKKRCEHHERREETGEKTKFFALYTLQNMSSRSSLLMNRVALLNVNYSACVDSGLAKYIYMHTGTMYIHVEHFTIFTLPVFSATINIRKNLTFNFR